ncbi:MAG TPA: sugar phosphate isomerase/epimerase, partial [Mycobacterium sp.]|nr:sugar phosphate isomerase/epimerase [Mycobacterium sp.]
MRPAIKVGLSTASVYPLRAEAAFEYAARLGYDGVELMVWSEAVS